MHHATNNMLATLCAIAIASLAMGCGKTETGTVRDVTAGSVTVADETSFTQTTFKVAPDADIRKDGEPASLEDVKPGDDVSVKVKQDTDGNEVATFVSVESSEAAGEGSAQPPGGSPSDPAVKEGTVDDAEPSPTIYEGHVMAVQEGMLTLVDPSGTQLSFIVDDHTEITVDEQPANLQLISEDAEVTVTARPELDVLMAVKIEASSTAEQPPAADQETDRPNETDPEPSDEGAGPNL